MTDNEIIKALECCAVAYDCPVCPFECDCGNMGNLSSAAIDLINRQRAELEELKEDYTPKLKWGLKRANEIGMSQDAEIERLKAENKILSKNADTAFQDGLNEAQDLYAAQIQDKIKSEAIKEFAERLCNGRLSNDPVVIAVKAELKEIADENENV